MTDLRQRLHDTLDGQHTDLVALAIQARTRGTQLRRRHRLAMASGILAMTAVVALGVLSATQLLPRSLHAQPGSGFTVQEAATVPATGASVVAALYSAVKRVAAGTGDRFHGFTTEPDDQAGKQATEAVSGMFAFTPAGSSSPGEVSVSVSRQGESGILDTPVPRCPDKALDCERTQLADDTEVVSFRLHEETTKRDPAGRETVYAERLVDDVLVMVSATNGLFSPELTEQQPATRPTAVLSARQVVDIVSQPWWGLELPSRFSEPELPSYSPLPGEVPMLHGATG